MEELEVISNIFEGEGADLYVYHRIEILEFRMQYFQLLA
jgi:hypothetical protein